MASVQEPSQPSRKPHTPPSFSITSIRSSQLSWTLEMTYAQAPTPTRITPSVTSKPARAVNALAILPTKPEPSAVVSAMMPTDMPVIVDAISGWVSIQLLISINALESPGLTSDKKPAASSMRPCEMLINASMIFAPIFDQSWSKRKLVIPSNSPSPSCSHGTPSRKPLIPSVKDNRKS